MSENNNQSGSVKLPGNYFAKAKLEYSNWILAWFREAIQNSVDGGAKNIDFKIEIDPTKPEVVKVSCQDDGIGMDKDTLFDVFLSMGGSKKAEGAIGGFGYAKVLLAFAHRNYEIETHGLRVKGVAGDYTWDSIDSDLPGVKLSVDMDLNDANPHRLESALHNIVHHSRLKAGVQVRLNGEALLSKNIDHPYSQSTVLGELTFKDQPHGYTSSQLWVRMNGLAMFSTSLWNKGATAFEGYLDLSGSSKDVLTSNRDSLSREHGQVLNELLQVLANDREKLKLTGDIDLVLNQKNVKTSDLSEESQWVLGQEAKSQNLTPEEFLERLVASADEQVSDLVKNPFQSLLKDVKNAKSQLDQKIGKIPEAWYPTNFKVKFADDNVNPENSHKFAGQISDTMSKKKIGKLAAGWDSIVRTLLGNEKYRNLLGVEKEGNGEFYYRGSLIQTGFVFGKPEGLNVFEKDKQRVSILMNPKCVTEKDFTVGDLVALAQHELTHVLVDSHYEEFTTKEFEIRRVARNDIGAKTFEVAFRDATSAWMAEHSGAKQPARPKVIEREQEYGLN